MDKEEGFVIDLDNIPVEDVGKKEKTVEVTPPEKEVEKPVEEADETVLVEKEEEDWLTFIPELSTWLFPEKPTRQLEDSKKCFMQKISS